MSDRPQPNVKDEDEYDDDEYSITFDAPVQSNQQQVPRPSQPQIKTDVKDELYNHNDDHHDGQEHSGLPAEDESVYLINLDELKDKPWTRQGADLTDYFNYGFTEESWNEYRQKQLDIKRATRQGKSIPTKPLTTQQQQQQQSNNNTNQYLDDSNKRLQSNKPQQQQQQQQQRPVPQISTLPPPPPPPLPGSFPIPPQPLGQFVPDNQNRDRNRQY